ncbi:protein 4.1 isoform X1 [Oreochromis niloticus]|uniref:protein 4.1 isoform X1 n=1 Tax=Oreochromis niloticus TaxID=8128 RepID=UPI00039434F2|nr:protein 4.1 isoform X1 [Oreochromis niloticus]XP_025758018.1 protein 4.1 isoform X1 [Oreochromis niloticus]XP_025758019.1 protein 4.1 isoform X1 [Oreochromis niloticus]
MTTDEAESHQKKPRQQEEAGQGARPPTPEDDQLRPQNHNSAGRGLTRLFSSLLKRRSQCESEGGEKEDKEEEAKAPIADPEPELKTEGEVALDQHSVSSAEAQATQVEKKETDEDKVGKEKEKHEDKEGEVTLEKEEEKDKEKKEEEEESGPEEGSRGEKEEKTAEEEAKASRVSRRPKTMQIKVTLLDDTLYECELDKHAKGQELFMKVCDHLNLLEKDYYGLAIWETPTMKTWMDLTKEIRRQVQGANYNFTFNVKFYPPDPAQLSEDITRYYLCLQLRKDILQGRLPCSFVTLALLGSYALQSELGEYDPEVHGSEYAKEMKMAQGQTKELEDKMMELHRTYRSMSPAQADLMFLENAKKLSMYGVDLHQAKDLDGVDIILGVCASGLMVYKDKLRINRFPWPKVLKVSYKRSSFFIKIRPSEVEHYESAIGFKLPNYKAAKKLWKVCVEHHTFFRLTSSEMATTPRKFLALGSKFRYSGRTQAQTRQASSLIDRPAPLFQRSSSKRNSRSLDGAMVSTPDNKSSRPVSAPVMSPVSPGEATPSPLLPTLPRSDHHDVSTPRGHRYSSRKAELKAECLTTDSVKSHSPKSTPEIKTVGRRERRHAPSLAITNGEKERKSQHSLQDRKMEMVRVRKKRSKKLEGETIYIRHSNLMLEQFGLSGKSVLPQPLKDLDKTQTEIMRHHTSISELKRSFMESVPEPRPSEWDKRLSTNSPFRTASINGQLQPASPVLKTQTITISDVTNSVRGTAAYKDIPLVHTETKTITYESAQPVDSVAERESGVLLSAQTITSETISTTTTTQITKTVKGGISETRIEKRIVITGDTEIDHDKALAQAIKEAKEQHPDMSVTKVVVHQETEITPE